MLKIAFFIKKTLPVIKTLEGLVYIPHLNIYNNNYSNIVKLETLIIIIFIIKILKRRLA